MVTKPDARFAQYMLEQFCGATCERTAALQYGAQSFHVEDAGIRDMLQDVAVEELSHLAVVAMLILQLSSGAVEQRAKRSTRFAMRGMGPHLPNPCGQAWSAACVHEDGNVMRDLRADIGAEAGARQTWEALMKMVPDEGTLRALHFLYTRKVTHIQMFMAALDRRGKLDAPLFGVVLPDETVDIDLNLSRLGGEAAVDRSPALVGAGMPVTDAPASLIETGEAPGFTNLGDEKPGAAPMDAVNAECKRGGKAK